MIDSRIALALLLAVALIGISAATGPDLQMAPLNPDFVAYQEARAPLAASDAGHPPGLTPSPLDLSHLDRDAGL
ncbi:MAG: hypothetical protein ACP5C4_07265 [Methanomicrobiales archaeon]